ncbi:plastocyanin/azurin family copper-binding protein [Horticoccus sp. 23ND18S-11]|uniref:plastocyanin/azurin family copper-binding protein n=1 Tax=Horticoccus sp. 23ND18S-11 TaxID=3391832 RepID=UPI0039C90908
MTTRLLPLAVFAALLVAGCGKKADAPATTAAAAASGPASAAPAAAAAAPAAAKPAAAPAAAPAPAAAAGRVIEITANDQMKFSLANIDAKAGEDLKVVFTNAGTLPKEAMGHNWVLLKAGVDVTAFATTAMTAKETDYVPASLKDQVIASTKVLGPKQTAEVSFKAPAAGTYTFICSFPGHYMIMKGTLTVK